MPKNEFFVAVFALKVFPGSVFSFAVIITDPGTRPG